MRLSKINQAINGFTQVASINGVQQETRGLLIDLALAEAIAKNTKIPTTPLKAGTFKLWYIANAKTQVDQLLGTIIEEYVFSLTKVESLVVRILELKYQLIAGDMYLADYVANRTTLLTSHNDALSLILDNVEVRSNFTTLCREINTNIVKPA